MNPEYQSKWYPLKKTCIPCGKDKLLNDFDIYGVGEQAYCQTFDHVDINLPPNTLYWLNQYLEERIKDQIRLEEIKKGNKIEYRDIEILDYVLKSIECGATTTEAYVMWREYAIWLEELKKTEYRDIGALGVILDQCRNLNVVITESYRDSFAFVLRP